MGQQKSSVIVTSMSLPRKDQVELAHFRTTVKPATVSRAAQKLYPLRAILQEYLGVETTKHRRCSSVTMAFSFWTNGHGLRLIDNDAQVTETEQTNYIMPYSSVYEAFADIKAFWWPFQVATCAQRRRC
jgi:hypothetical protein